MDERIRKALWTEFAQEPLAQTLGMELAELGEGYAAVTMTYDPAQMANIFGRAHGGALFALVDGAFEAAGQTDGTVAVALNVNVTYVASPDDGARLRAEARRVSQTKRTASYDIRVTDGEGRLLATCSALAYRTGKPLPFLAQPQ